MSNKAEKPTRGHAKMKRYLADLNKNPEFLRRIEEIKRHIRKGESGDKKAEQKVYQLVIS